MAGLASGAITIVNSFKQNATKAFRSQYTQEDYANESDPQKREAMHQEDAETIKARFRLGGQIATGAIGVAAATYNIQKSTTRFGYRGQDIQDEKKIQDKLVNYGFGIAGATATGLAIGGIPGAIGGAVTSAISIAVGEVIGVVQQDKQYAYNKAVDADTILITRARMGEGAYNYSRRNYV